VNRRPPPPRRPSARLLAGLLACAARAAAPLALAAPALAAQPASAAPAAPAAPAAATAEARAFGRLVERLSEPGGYFDTDNLISNERGYLHVLGALGRLGVRGGAYVGVGPDQNFSYIARVRPSVAFVIDVRRDNLLQHLMFKALFARARNRAEYLALLVGRPAPADVARWADRPVDAIVAHVDATPATPESVRAAREAVLAGARRSGVALTAADLATIARFHQAFVDAGLGLQFTSAGRAPRPYYPTLRQLVLERDLEGNQASYLAREDDFQFVKALQRRHLVVPVVGDLAGPHALAAIGRAVRERGERVSAFYTSNVEDYLMRAGSFGRYARTVASLPRDRRSVIIRSYFGGNFGDPHPQAVPGHFSTQLLQMVDAFAADVAAGGYASYRDLVLRGPVPLR
jgi:hypothetical protein